MTKPIKDNFNAFFKIQMREYSFLFFGLDANDNTPKLEPMVVTKEAIKKYASELLNSPNPSTPKPWLTIICMP